MQSIIMCHRAKKLVHRNQIQDLSFDPCNRWDHLCLDRHVEIRRRRFIGRGAESFDRGKFFEQYDILLLPTTPIPAPFIEGNESTPKEYAVEQARRLTRFTAPFNLTGLPAISIPCGFSKDGLPIGLQIVSWEWGEASVLRAARSYEHETGWGARRPPIVEE